VRARPPFDRHQSYLIAQPPGGAAPWLVAGRTYHGYERSPGVAAARHTARCGGALRAS
jgi:hypothetical protein